MIRAEELAEKLQKAGRKVNIDKLMPVIEEIEELKKEKDALILAHTYVEPEIIYSVADFTGDSYALSKDAFNSGSSVIVFAAVRFMGETAKILSPSRTVLVPAENPGCTLADSITATEVRNLREKYPDYKFICYINTTAEVKAECDICVTSSNVYNIVEKVDSDKILFLPDRLMGENLTNEMKKRGIKKEIITAGGNCYVHNQYSPEYILEMKNKYENLFVLAHPECTPEVLFHTDFAGSTSQIFDKIAETESNGPFLILSESGLTARLKAEFPDKQFAGECPDCRYMKSNSLENILRVLKNPRPDDYINIESSVLEKASECVAAMFRYTENK